MKTSTLGFCAAVVAIASCGAQSQIAPSDPVVGGIAQARTAVPACTGSRIGQAQCGVLIESGGARATVSGWTAADLESAYRLPASTKGKGQTVAVVDAYDNPDVTKDLAKYRSTMGLPKGKFNKYNQDGQMTNYPQGSPDWGVETDLDTQMAAASCPNCTIDLIEVNSSQWSDIEAGVAEAVKLGATIVSNSFDGTGGDEKYWDAKGITFVASAGDSGFGLYDPATFDHVVAVGGTTLAASGNKRGYTESLWQDSGGGCSSTGERKPRWQLHRPDHGCAYRLGDDVSAVANNVAEYDTYDEAGWITVDGSSISTPLIAGMFALAGNSTHQNGGRTFWEKAHHPYLHVLGGKRFTEQGGWGSPHGIRAF